jgi:3-hydroxyacyl-CoA dehydrogenase
MLNNREREPQVSASSKIVSLEQLDFIGLICVENPPVNAISHAVRTGVADGITRAVNKPHTQALLIMSSGDHFSAGADINEFDSPAKEPSQREIQAMIEAARVPVVAAIHGLALGGGLELAMACHYRIAHTEARLGLPEITLGIIPGAGGTQRLPRLIGARAALEMILSGAPISAAEAKAKGLVDEVVIGDLREAALLFCRQLVSNGCGPRPTSNRAVPGDWFGEESIAEILRGHSRTLKERTTPNLAIEAIKAARLPFSEGIRVETDLARKSLATRESQALRNLFFAERASAKAQGITAPTTRPDITRVAIIGAGTMGSGIATAFANAGCQVTLIDNDKTALARAQETIRSNYKSSVQRGRIEQNAAEERIARITSSLALADAAAADLVIEAVFEDMDLKKRVLLSLDSILPPERLIATNTSTLSITELGRATAHPHRVLGLHFFAPAHVTKLLEIVRGGDTSAESLAIALHIAKSLKKIPVVSGDGFGFIGNRMMLDGYFREAEQLLLEGASPTQVDTALENFGFAMGPLRVSDLGGNDVGTKARIQLCKLETRPDPYFVIAHRLTELGRLGQKTGRGFYHYEPGSREALPDPDVIKIIDDLASKRRITRSKISDEEIVERCVLSLINVGAMVLDEGIAARAADIDVVWTSGCGFPRHLGGPMFYADTLSLDYVAERIRHYHASFGRYWQPAALIERLAEEGSNFEKWDRLASRFG